MTFPETWTELDTLVESISSDYDHDLNSRLYDDDIQTQMVNALSHEELAKALRASRGCGCCCSGSGSTLRGTIMARVESILRGGL